MGIDIRVESTIDEEWTKSIGLNANCKWAWASAEIDWYTVFEFIRFDPTKLYDHMPNYWSCEQLECVLNELVKLKTNPEEFGYAYSLNEILEKSSDIDKLIEFFTEYVNKKCRMIVN